MIKKCDKPFYIWNKWFPDFSTAIINAEGPGFSGKIYRDRALRAANECLNALNSGKPIPSFHKQRSTFLSPVVAMLLVCKKKINILDFGGGLGIGYISILENFSDSDLKRVDYTILEVPEVCITGSNLHGSNIRYITDLSMGCKFDLVYAASSLQYVENWQELIEKFIELGPKYILLSDVFAGNINSYVSLQNYYGSKIPHWFLSLKEVLAIFEISGYKLIMKSYATSRRLAFEDFLPMDNFPTELQLPQTLNLFFHKICDE